jgi:hypothetical protein
MYDTAPILLFIQVNSRVFVEQYHYGIAEEERQTALTKCLGKKVPVLEFSRNSAAGRLYLSHFNYIWETSSDRKIYHGLSNALRRALEEKAWLNVYNGTKDISMQYLVTPKAP